MDKSESYITVRDHKDKFKSKQPRRFIDPTKNGMGRISGQNIIHDDINGKLDKKLNVTY